VAQILHLQFLGAYRLTYGDVPVTTVNTDRLQSLLAYLVLHRGAAQTRRQIAALIWPDSPEAQARSNLRNLLFQLRQALPDSDLFVAADASTLQWRPGAPYVLDVAQFEQALEAAAAAQAAGDRPAALRQFETAASLYTGDLLPGNYDDWLLPWREQVHTRYLDALAAWSRLLEEAGDLPAAVRAVQRLLQQDLLNESAYVRLMELYARLGDRAGLQHIYAACVAALQRELDVEPSPVTQAAYAQALATVVQLSGQPTAPPPAPAPALTPPPRRPRLPVAATPFAGRVA
jgi:DNA-binding SARP family transcriptional activator